MNSQTLKVKNGTINLPRELKQKWQGAEVFVLSTKDSLIFKRVEKPLNRLTDLAGRITSPKMSSQEIEGEIQAYRQE